MKSFRKNIAFAGIAIIVLLSLAGCAINWNDSQPQDDVQSQDDANQQMIQDLQNQIKDLQAQIDEQAEAAIPTPTPGPAPAVRAPTASDSTASFIAITSPANQTSVHTEPVEFAGAVSPNAVRIGVKATTASSSQVDDYILTAYEAGDTTFRYGAAGKWNNLQEGTNSYVFTAYYEDGSSKSTSVTIYYTDGGAEMGKPVIYLYPKKEMNVDVNVKPTNGISVSEPAINGGWHVSAKPNGQLTNLADNKVYPYLFWEGFASNFVTPKEGFVVAQDDVSKFFDAKLSYLGLNGKEISDFKEFWIPRLKSKPYYFITFIDQKSFDAYAPLTVNPKPDSVIRVFFDYKGLDAKVSVPAQKLTPGVRTGFTVTEWGGRLYR